MRGRLVGGGRDGRPLVRLAADVLLRGLQAHVQVAPRVPERQGLVEHDRRVALHPRGDLAGETGGDVAQRRGVADPRAERAGGHRHLEDAVVGDLDLRVAAQCGVHLLDQRSGLVGVEVGLLVQGGLGQDRAGQSRGLRAGDGRVRLPCGDQRDGHGGRPVAAGVDVDQRRRRRAGPEDLLHPALDGQVDRSDAVPHPGLDGRAVADRDDRPVRRTGGGVVVGQATGLQGGQGARPVEAQPQRGGAGGQCRADQALGVAERLLDRAGVGGVPAQVVADQGGGTGGRVRMTSADQPVHGCSCRGRWQERDSPDGRVPNRPDPKQEGHTGPGRTSRRRAT